MFEILNLAQQFLHHREKGFSNITVGIMIN